MDSLCGCCKALCKCCMRLCGCCFTKCCKLDVGVEPSSRTRRLPLEMPLIVRLFDNVNVVSVDTVIIPIENFVNSLQTKPEEGKSIIEFVTPSEKRANSISEWASFVKGGGEILEFVNKQIQPKEGVASQLLDAREAVTALLKNVAKFHWIAGVLSIIAYLLDQIGEVQDNRIECIKLLDQMVKLARHIRALKYDMPEEGKRFSDAILMIFEGSMICASLLKSKTLFSFLRDSVDYTRLNSLRLDISRLYDDLNLRTTHPPLQPMYPDYAVGIEEPQNQVIKRLDMTAKMESSLSVVIYGIGGVGKTTLANAVVAMLDLKGYNYTRVEIHEDPVKNDLLSIQLQILKDTFPQYENGRNLTLRDCEEGRNHLTRAFQCHANKPVFIFIDNAHRRDDLKQILPSDLRGLPRRSRILVTTRNLSITEMLRKSGLELREYQLNALHDEHAKEILLKRTGEKVDVNKDQMDNIVRVCGGIPLLLEIVASHMKRQEYRVSKSTWIVEALEKGTYIKEENVTKRLFEFVYNELEESTQQAFLDICCFFTNWSRRHVEYILGPEEATLLEDAAFVKASTENEMIVPDVIRAIGIRKSERSRIRDLQSFEEAVKDEEVKVKGVWLTEEAEDKYELKGALLCSMQNSLRVLALGSRVRITERIQNTSKFQELRFLQIVGDVPYLPVDLESLERLAMYHGPFCVEGVNICLLPKNIRALKATGQSNCTDLSTQWRASQSMLIRQNSSLEELDLQELKSLQSLPDSLDHLTALHILLLDDCEFQVLPEQICRLSSLIELKLTSCKKLTELPSRFGELVALKKLNLAECMELKKLPESFTQLSCLEVLNLECCWKLEVLPSNFGELKNLNKLSLESNALKELPSSFGKLRSLRELKCSCMELQELPDSFEQFQLLTKLDLSCCMKLRRLPRGMEKLSLLKTLNLRRCDGLKELPPFAYEREGKHLTTILPDHLLGKRQ